MFDQLKLRGFKALSNLTSIPRSYWLTAFVNQVLGDIFISFCARASYEPVVKSQDL